MFEITRETTFSASHQLREYRGKCERLHGHNYKVHICVEGVKLDPLGMLIDFHELDDILAAAVESFDHQNLNDVEPFDKLNPSAENLAMIIAKRVGETLPADRIHVKHCDVWENDRSRARYIP